MAPAYDLAAPHQHGADGNTAFFKPFPGLFNGFPHEF
jgi:hypothetical protein